MTSWFLSMRRAFSSSAAIRRSICSDTFRHPCVRSENVCSTRYRWPVTGIRRVGREGAGRRCRLNTV